MTGTKLSGLRPLVGQTRSVAGLVAGLRTLNTRNGRMAIVTLDDRTARIEVRVFTELLAGCRDMLERDRLLVVEGEIVNDEFSGECALVASAIDDLESARERCARCILIELDCESVNDDAARTLRDALESHRTGGTPVHIDYRRPDARATLALGDAWTVRPSDDLIARLRDVAGATRVQVEY